MSDRTEEFLRRGLMACKRPRPAPDLVASIIGSLQSRQRVGRDRALARRFYLLCTYWALAGALSVWILGTVPWYSDQVAWLIPVCGAAWLWSSKSLRGKS